MTATAVLPAAALPAPRQRGGPLKKRKRAGRILVSWALLHAMIWIGAPLITALIMSFTSYDVLTPPRFIGLDNYVAAFNDAVFRKAIVNTMIYALFTVPVAMGIALLIALLLNTKVVGRGIFRTAIFIPQITATIAVALVWLWIYEPQSGLANAIVAFFGLPTQGWLSSTTFALPAVILVGIWQGIGLKMLIYLAALQGLPHELYEAADVDGAPKWRQLFSITVPLLKPATFFVFVTAVISAFQSFDQIYILTDGGPANSTTMMTYEIYKSAFREFRMGYACAQSIVLFIVLLSLTLINRRITRGDRAT